MNILSSTSVYLIAGKVSSRLSIYMGFPMAILCYSSVGGARITWEENKMGIGKLT